MGVLQADDLVAITAAVWNITLPGSYAAGTAGATLGALPATPAMDVKLTYPMASVKWDSPWSASSANTTNYAENTVYFAVGQLIRLESEDMLVTGVSVFNGAYNLITVIRGCNGTTIATHSEYTIGTYPTYVFGQPIPHGYTAPDNTTISAIWNKVGTIGTGAITVTSPLGVCQALALQAGDDYLAVDSRAIDVTATTWPDITGASIEWRGRIDTTSVTSVGSVIDASTARAELTRSTTTALGVGHGRWQLVATLTDGSIVTLVTGVLTVTAAV